MLIDYCFRKKWLGYTLNWQAMIGLSKSRPIYRPLVSLGCLRCFIRIWFACPTSILPSRTTRRNFSFIIIRSLKRSPQSLFSLKWPSLNYHAGYSIQLEMRNRFDWNCSIFPCKISNSAITETQSWIITLKSTWNQLNRECPST